MRSRRYFTRRVFQAILTLWLVLTLNFFLFRLLPGDPVRLLFSDPRVSLEALGELRKSFGLDEPMIIQYFQYLKNTLSGEFGISFTHRTPVSELLSVRIVNTVVLLLPATLLSIVMGTLLGMVAALFRGRPFDILSLGLSQLLWATPVFWFGLMLMMFSANFLPLSGMRTAGLTGSWWAQTADLWRHLVMPMTTLALVQLGQYTILMRSSMLEVLSQPYMTTAKALGLTQTQRLFRHALPNAGLPVMTLAAVNLGLMVGGAIQTETVFTWPGVGRLIYEALIQRDYPVLQGAFLVIAVFGIAANLLVDLIYSAVDPRIQE